MCAQLEVMKGTHSGQDRLWREVSQQPIESSNPTRAGERCKQVTTIELRVRIFSPSISWGECNCWAALFRVSHLFTQHWRGQPAFEHWLDNRKCGQHLAVCLRHASSVQFDSSQKTIIAISCTPYSCVKSSSILPCSLSDTGHVTLQVHAQCVVDSSFYSSGHCLRPTLSPVWFLSSSPFSSNFS